MKEQPKSALGAAIIESYLKTLPGTPGVYRMINAENKVLYVGKAKSLKKRVAAYTKPERQSVRIRRMISETVTMEFVTTHTEAEALLLESNFIKRFAPRYNILLRDDKSFPFILVTKEHKFSQVLKFRGSQNRPGDYFGPFASVWAVNETLAVLQRAFMLRTCTDSVFSNRTRPCLLYQIKRCSAPCVGFIDEAEYRESVEQAHAFLSGDSQQIQRKFAGLMQDASDRLEFELAAQYRDRIRALTRIQAHQDINLSNLKDSDVIATHQAGGATCIQVFFFRSGANFGNRAYFPSHAREDDLPTVLEAFVGQFYARTPPPGRILLSDPIPNVDLVTRALCVRADRKVELSVPKRGDKRKLMDHALVNAKEALDRRMAESASQRRLLEGLAERFGLDGPPNRIEVYDNSHVSGTRAVGAMIVAGPEGFNRSSYRKFNIRGARDPHRDEGPDNGYAPGDDYAMMHEVLTRRFSRALKEDPDRTDGQWPDLVLVDGGKGQLGIALEVFQELGIEDVDLAAIAKGPDRNAGRERIFLPGAVSPITLQTRDPVSYFLQRIRDEAHRFAIGAHRTRRSKAIGKSVLDDIPGVGARRKKALLHHFGDSKSVAQAGKSDLAAVEGISKSLAAKVYDWFHSDG
ncbi:MAG: excinuclease ABC subunit UvrC [Rhodospirillaceae bacterium]|nr:excinuclease ABC subunit UvrC [Rhodospirillaceae bacterium]MBT5299195.1 excinuclease ABC subunit UvrC [Rhodospirillaceae bacterium]MBT5513176.1 excinuclease ABC subunit UvrC [Rhodospirillaceae bacterium]MBT6085307.1 excinuclease ABC subunit UvrC [Rhodospirillaceae bacterium]